MKSELDISTCCFNYYLGRKEAENLPNKPLEAQIINKTNGKRIPGTGRVSLSVEESVVNANADFYPEGSTLSHFKKAKFIISSNSYKKLLEYGELHTGCGPIAEIYVGILGRIKHHPII